MKQKQFYCGRTFRFRKFVQKAYAAFNSMHKAVTIGVAIGFVLTLSHSTKAASQNKPALAGDSISAHEWTLDDLVVTSSKAELTLGNTAKMVTVITRDEIEREPVQSVQDLLKNVVGLDVRQRGSNGVLAGISVRGGTFEQTAILLNGVNLSNPQTAHYSLDLPVNLSDIDHIEIIQGPTSLLYGASAFSGGINIVTKKDSGTGGSLNLEGGMHQLFGAEARGSLQTEFASHSLSAGYNSSAGYIANSDYKIFNALWQSNFHIDNSKLNFQLGVNDKDYGANTFYSAKYPSQYEDTRSIFAAVKGETGGKLKFIPQLYWNRHSDCFQLIRNRPDRVPYNYHRTDVFGFNLNAQFQWLAGITNFGGELRNEGIYSSSLGKELKTPEGKFNYSDNRTNISYFVEHTYIYHPFTLGLGFLANYNTAFTGDFGFYPNINAAYRLTSNWKLFASWNTATRNPTFTDLYYKGDTTHKGFPDLQPEKSESLDGGVQYNSRPISASVNVFYMKGKNMIDWIKEKPTDPLWEARNLTHLNKTGFEVNTVFRLGEWMPLLSSTRLNLGYLFMNQSNDAGNLISAYVLDYLRHKFTAGLSHPIYKGLSADWQFRWQKREGSFIEYKNLEPLPEPTPYPAFSLLDVKLNWQCKNWKVYLSANNLFNVSYYDLGNIPQPGIGVIGGVGFEL